MSGFERFPRHLHRPGGVFHVVNDDAELKAGLAAGWYLTPLDAEQAGAVPAEDAPVPATQPEDALTGLNAPQAIELIEATDDVAELEAWKLAELAGKARKGVLAALDVRLAALTEA